MTKENFTQEKEALNYTLKEQITYLKKWKQDSEKLRKFNTVIKLSCKRENKNTLNFQPKKTIMKEKQIIIRGLLLSFCFVLFYLTATFYSKTLK